jgi:hypothetical protein
MLCCREERRATPTSNAVSGHRRYIIDQEPGPQPVPLFHHPSLHAAHQGPRPSPPLDYSSSQYDGSPAAANAHAIPSITVDHEGKLVIAIDFGGSIFFSDRRSEKSHRRTRKEPLFQAWCVLV